jgi:hypothetical protein
MAQQKTKRINFMLPVDTVESIEKLAAKKNQNVSAVIRRAINEHLTIQTNREDIEFISGVLRQVVSVEIGRQANRLAAMLFKVGVISAGNYFMAVRLMSDVISPSMQEDFKDINTNARRLGVDYMKQNGVGVVDFLEDADEVEAAVRKLKTDFSEM